MKTYDDEYIGFETLLPSEIVDLLHSQQYFSEESLGYVDSELPVLDEHELAMAA